MRAKVVLEGKGEVEARIVFRHERGAAGYRWNWALRGGKGAPIVATTTAKVLVGEEVLAEAAAHCSVQDNFSRERGRELALHRLLNEAKHLPGPARAAIWAAYRDRPRGPQTRKDADSAGDS